MVNSLMTIACLVKMAGCWYYSCLEFKWTTTLSQSIKTHKKELGQYPAILTSHLVNNPYIFSCQIETFVYIFPNFQNCACCDIEKDLKDNKYNSLHLVRKYARLFVLRHYPFLEAHSFPWATLSVNCSLLRTDNVRGQISEHIFVPNGDYCLCIFNSLLDVWTCGKTRNIT